MRSLLLVATTLLLTTPARAEDPITLTGKDLTCPATTNPRLKKEFYEALYSKYHGKVVRIEGAPIKLGERSTFTGVYVQTPTANLGKISFRAADLDNATLEALYAAQDKSKVKCAKATVIGVLMCTRETRREDRWRVVQLRLQKVIKVTDIKAIMP